MPRATPDYRAARAVLAAPYPLPVVFTRHTRPDPLPDQVASASDQGGTSTWASNLLAGTNTTHGFPAYNTHWRELPPAIPPIPYPSTDGGAAPDDIKKRRISLARHGRKDSGANGEYELMSGIEEEPSRELRNAREIGAWSLEVGRQTVGTDSRPTEIHAGNVLTNTYQARLPVHFLGDRPLQASGPTVPSFADPPSWTIPLGLGPQPGLPGASGQSSTPTQPPQPHTWFNPPPFRRSRVALVRPSADIDSDDTLASDSDASLTASPQLVTPASNATSRRGSRASRSPAKVTPKKSKPLFLGQTGLSPFTYMPPARRRTGGFESSADEAGFETEATVRGTITRIARSRPLRGKHKQVASAPLSLPHRPNRPHRNGAKRSTAAAVNEAPAPQHASSTAGITSVSAPASNPANSVHDPPLTPPNQITVDRQICPLPLRKQAAPAQTPTPRFDQVLSPGHDVKCLGLGLEATQAFPRTPPSQVLQMCMPPSSGSSAPATRAPGWTHCSAQPSQPSKSWQPAPQLLAISPMHVGSGPAPQPSTTLSQLDSPFLLRSSLPSGQIGMVPPLNGSACLPQPAPGLAARSCLSDAPSGSSGSAARRPELPIAKLCHNFLLAKKLQAAKKRKMSRKHAAEVAEREKASLENALSWQTKAIQIDPPPNQPQGMSAATSVVLATATNMSMLSTAAHAGPSGATPAQAGAALCPSLAPFRAIESLARVDEARPPRKRRRAARSSSEDDSPAESIPMPAMFGGPTIGSSTVFRSTAVTRPRAWKAGKSRRDL